MSPNTSWLDSLASTGWWTAAARARESQRSDRLFNDAWAAILVGLHTLDEFNRAMEEYGTGTGDLHAVVTRFFDDFLMRVTSTHGVRQVVLVASGLDSRALRLPWSPKTRLFELDQPRVVAYKDSKFSLVGATPGCERHVIGVDLNEPWTDSLCEVGFVSSERSVWLLEGFLYFLAESAVMGLLDAIARLAAPGSWLALDVVNGDMLTCPSTRHWNERMSAAGMPWLFTSEHPEALLGKFGWTTEVVQAGEEGANFGRLPQPPPRCTAGVPRCFLVTATRQEMG
jgi:methyltransferase (TIGR00027 family)